MKISIIKGVSKLSFNRNFIIKRIVTSSKYLEQIIYRVIRKDLVITVTEAVAGITFFILISKTSLRLVRYETFLRLYVTLSKISKLVYRLELFLIFISRKNRIFSRY